MKTSYEQMLQWVREQIAILGPHEVGRLHILQDIRAAIVRQEQREFERVTAALKDEHDMSGAFVAQSKHWH